MYKQRENIKLYMYSKPPKSVYYILSLKTKMESIVLPLFPVFMGWCEEQIKKVMEQAKRSVI